MMKLKGFFFNCYYFIFSIPYLIGSGLSIYRKFIVALSFLRGNILNQLLGIKFIYIGKFVVSSFNGSTVLGLFGEVFLKNEYFFEAKDSQPIIIDCGANTGMTTIYYKRLYPNSHVYSFEPNKKAFSILKKNIISNKITNVDYYQKAVGDYNGKIDFYDTEKPSFTTGIISGRSGEYKKTEVECISFSDFLENKKIDLLKMDIEGAEDSVFFDMYKKGSFKYINEIILEYHHNIPDIKSNLSNILSILQEEGYQYSINSLAFLPYKTNKFQDLLIHAKKI